MRQQENALAARHVILTPARWHPLVSEIMRGIQDVEIADGLSGLEGGGTVLMAFASGVVVPRNILSTYGMAYNFHAASPEFPGRDPHHWAIYEGASHFGVTLHRMIAAVDAGPIIATARFPIGAMGAQELRRHAELWLVAMFAQWAPWLIEHDPPTMDVRWGVKRRRADLLAMLDCRDLPPQETERRRRAFTGFALTV